MSQLKQHYLLGITIIVLLASGRAYAANKTGVTDSLREGEVRIDLSYSLMTVSPGGTYSVGSNSSSLSGHVTQSNMATTYNLGVTDTINIKVVYGFSQNTNQELDYTSGPNSYVDTTQWTGATSPEIGIQYVLDNRKQSGIWAVVYGGFSPAAPFTAPVSEIKTNGVAATSGVVGNSNNGYATTRAGATVSFPVYAGSAFANFEYSNGDNSVNYAGSTSGVSSTVTFGVEHRMGNSAKLRPYLRVPAMGSCYRGQGQSAFFSCFDVGVLFIKDVSKSFSLELLGQLGTLNQAATNYTNGSTLTLSQSGYTVGVQGMFFY